MSKIGFGLVSLTKRNKIKEPEPVFYDRGLLFLVLALLAFGWVMVTSASLPISEKLYNNEYYISIKHAGFIIVALMSMLVVLFFKMQWWQRFNMQLLLVAVVLLIAVLLVGSTVNGSRRWLSVGIFNLQAAEVAKLFFFSFLAGYLVRQHEQLRENVIGFAKPLVVFMILAILLLM